MMDIIIAFSIFLFLLIIVYIKRIKSDNKVVESTTTTHSTQQPAVIKPVRKHLGVVLKSSTPDSCCQAANNLIGQLLEEHSIPSLPLPGCDQKSCACFFQKKYNERKGQERRDVEDRRDDIRFEDKMDRRSHIDRRKHSSMWNKDRS